MISVDSGTTASYVYNALGQRVEKDVGGYYTEYVYDKNGSQAGEYNRTAWESWADFEGRHLFHFQGGNTYFTHMDRLGTTAIVTSWATGNVVQDELHYPWGQEWAMAGTMQEERFAMLQHRDSATDFDPARFRLYASGDGRWQSPDPAGQFSASAADPQSFNRYAYVQNNPARGTDPTGLYTYWCGSMLCTSVTMDSSGLYEPQPNLPLLPGPQPAAPPVNAWSPDFFSGGNYCGNGFPCGPGPSALSSPMSACYRHNFDYDPTICRVQRAAHDLAYETAVAALEGVAFVPPAPLISSKGVCTAITFAGTGSLFLSAYVVRVPGWQPVAASLFAAGGVLRVTYYFGCTSDGALLVHAIIN